MFEAYQDAKTIGVKGCSLCFSGLLDDWARLAFRIGAINGEIKTARAYDFVRLMCCFLTSYDT
jgi:hypothetical protein